MAARHSTGRANACLKKGPSLDLKERCTNSAWPRDSLWKKKGVRVLSL